MIEQPHKIHFSLLPFSPQLSYIEIKGSNTIQNTSSYSNISCDSNDEEFERRNNENLNLCDQKCIIEDNSLKNNKSKPVSRRKKTFAKLNEKGQNFQFSFYQIFTTRKKFPKKYVILIHNEICINLNLRRINRDETRSISQYFDDFADHSEKILLFIKNNKEEVMRRLPELQKILS